MKHIPDKQQIERLLEQTQPNTTQRLDQRLSNAPWTLRVVNRHRTLRFAGLIALLSVLLFAATPPGRALAQEILLQFFHRTESDTFTVQSTPLSFEATTPFYAECGTTFAPTCSVEQILAMVNFEVKELAKLPEGLYFAGATGGPNQVTLQYQFDEAHGLGGILIFVESKDVPGPNQTDIAPKSAVVEKIQIGTLPGEYFTGALFEDGMGNVSWKPDYPQATLRWLDGNSIYTMYYHYHNDPFSKDELIELAESMTYKP